MTAEAKKVKAFDVSPLFIFPSQIFFISTLLYFNFSRNRKQKQRNLTKAKPHGAEFPTEESPIFDTTDFSSAVTPWITQLVPSDCQQGSAIPNSLITTIPELY